jgi:hypothetical protein
MESINDCELDTIVSNWIVIGTVGGEKTTLVNKICETNFETDQCFDVVTKKNTIWIC